MSKGGQIPVWLDCDPGHDDAVAIILAGWTPSLELLGVSTVAGNQTVEKVTRNALDVLHAAGLGHIDVVAGQAKPLVRPSPILCPEIHGDSGLDGPGGGPLFPHSPRTPLAGRKAVNVMFNAISAAHARHGGSSRVRLVCTGSLTNVALLLSVYPELVPLVEVVLMGGCLGVGNTGPVVEFNIQTDPEAARVVFDAGVPLTMVPLEVTHTALVTPAVVAQLMGVGSEASASSSSGGVGSSSSSNTSAFRRSLKELLFFFQDTYRTVFKFVEPPLHDPCAVAYVIAPEIFEVEEMRVDIETSSALSAGQTVCDVWHQSRRPKNCRVALKMDVPAFWRLVAEAVHRADGASPLNT